MKTTILLPVYNDEKYIKFCIDSILKQINPADNKAIDFNCLIGFNGTKDRSKDIVVEMTSNDTRFNILDFGNDTGKAKTLNKMLRMVDTERISLIDGDDIWAPNKLWSQMRLGDDYDVIGSFSYYIDSGNNIIKEKKLDLAITHENIVNRMKKGDNNIINSSCFIKTSDVLEAGGWSEDLDLEDMDLWIKLMKMNKKFHNIPEYLVLHRLHPESNFNSNKLNNTPEDILRINNL